METAQSFVVSIDDSTGEYQFLVSDISSVLLDDTSIVNRASHVLPSNPVLRAFFWLIRVTWGDNGRMAQWTRNWPCKWLVNLTPSNGPILRGAWTDRQFAIQAEIAWLESNFL